MCLRAGPLVNFSLSFRFTTLLFLFPFSCFYPFLSFSWIMNALLTLVFISLCGITHALHMPVVARRQSHNGVQMQKIHVSQNVDNARDVVVGASVSRGRLSALTLVNSMLRTLRSEAKVHSHRPPTSITAHAVIPEFPIQLDTGSSDVWVMPPFPLDLTNKTDIQANLTFGIGEVTGNIAFANMSFGHYEVPSQGTWEMLRGPKTWSNPLASDSECDECHSIRCYF